MISLVDYFNQVSLHNPSQEVLKHYSHIEEIQEVDPRGFPMIRPLFSHSDMPSFLDTPQVNIEDFKWDKDFLYSVVLHHNNALAAKYLNVIPTKILQSIKQKQCKLILDNTMEGDRVEDFFNAIYKSINELNLPPQQIYYVTNSLVAEHEHEKFKHNRTDVKEYINVISFMYNVMDVQRLKKLGHLPEKVNIEDEIKYKNDNFDIVRPFLKVNRTGRPERNLLMLYINKYNLYDKYYISFPDYPDYDFSPYVHDLFPGLIGKDNIESLKQKCPFDIDSTDETNHGPPGHKPGMFNADLPFQPIHYKNSLISTIMCAFPFVEDCCHLHSSTFNPMYCGHPTISFGPYKHLSILKKLGFKTFDKWWDESYDNHTEGWKRLQSIFTVLNELNNRSNKEIFEMYKDMKDILQHNSDLIQNYNGKQILKNRIGING